MRVQSSFLGLVLSFRLLCVIHCEDIVVQVVQGKIRGKRINVLNKSVDAFLGIPYAEPPTGDRRFKPPVPKEHWPQILNATKYGDGCMQLRDEEFPGFPGTEMWNPNVNLSEDCLNLNVWTPFPRPSNAAVMVWIYGGSYFSGVSSLDVYDGKTLAAEENIVVVSMNYRLGALGFLAMGEEAPGNAGLRDQALALQWVQENVARFGGNPNVVTLFSESAGSASVSFHLLSPVSRNLFNRAVMQSASANAPWASYTKQEATRRGTLLAENLDCTESPSGQPYNTDEMVECMRLSTADEILNGMWVTSEFLNFAFVPVIDGTFVVETPEATLQKNAFKPCEIIMGSNTNEAFFFAIYEIPGFSLHTESLLDEMQFREAIEYCWPNKNRFAHNAIQFQYTDWLKPQNQASFRDALDQAAGDNKFVCPTFQFAKAYAEFNQDVYYYRFTQRASNHPFPDWMGVLHGDEIAYFFGLPLHPENGFSVEDKRLSRQMMAYYANFARTGNPNIKSDSDMEELRWPLHTAEDLEFLVLNESLVDVNMPTAIVGQGPRAKQCMFWENYLPELEAMTGNIDEAESQWKSEFREWSNTYMVNWKAEFDSYIYNKNKVCRDP
ncbi:cholinesterase-like [Anneissia japonica]|uniref:cholinesterase-like n=1 Tax=Anneissia japonica TaxID=1529436 RepID=UPI0014258FA6|nr:cholinesterase-like [Anneissia japonica]